MGTPVSTKTLGSLIQLLSSLWNRLVSLVAGSWMKPSDPITQYQYIRTNIRLLGGSAQTFSSTSSNHVWKRLVRLVLRTMQTSAHILVQAGGFVQLPRTMGRAVINLPCKHGKVPHKNCHYWQRVCLLSSRSMIWIHQGRLRNKPPAKGKGWQLLIPTQTP